MIEGENGNDSEVHHEIPGSADADAEAAARRGRVD
jgi:hypothetical protein